VNGSIEGQGLYIEELLGASAQTYTFDSFGKQTASSGSLTNPFQYTGREFDPETSLYYYRARCYDPSTGRFLSEDPARLEPNAFAYAANSPVNFTDPTGLTKGIPTDCEELRKYIEKLYRIFIAKEDQYDPEEDGSGMIPKRGGGFHAPGIHYQNLIFLQLKLLKALKQWDDTCGGRNNPPPVCDPERVKQPIPAPVFRKPTVAEATGAAAAAYILYRVLRFLPSLYPPLWWTIPENLALP
jgi:RHS repeat-associated protein